MRQRPGRRGVCPSLSAPLPTGDGLLVRLPPWSRWTRAAQLHWLAELSERYGNGDIELTSRGNLQARGFSASSAERFAVELSELMPQPPATPSVLLEPDTPRDVFLREMRDDLVACLAERALPLAAKCSVIVEAQGNLGVGALRADVRLRMDDDGYWLGVGGNARSARWFRCAEADSKLLQSAGIAVLELLAGSSLAQRGHELKHSARLTALLARWGAVPAVPRLCCDSPALGQINERSLLAAVPYGALNSAMLQAISTWCASYSAALWPLPQRRLLFKLEQVYELPQALCELESMGLIIDNADARLLISVCRGAPDCAAAHLKTRPLADRIAGVIASSEVSGRPVHVSGCAKGCARPNDAALCLVGESEANVGVVLHGFAHDSPACREALTGGNLSREQCEQLLRC